VGAVTAAGFIWWFMAAPVRSTLAFGPWEGCIAGCRLFLCGRGVVARWFRGAANQRAGGRVWRWRLLPPFNSPNPTSSPNRSCSQPTVTAAQDGPGISRAQLRKSHMNHMLLMAQLLCRTAPASAGRSYATSSTARRGARWTAASSRTATPPPSGQQACLPYCLLRQLMVLLACLHALQKVKLV